MKAQGVVGGLFEKPAAGFFLGCNSNKLSWLLLDSQYRWGVNIVNRGGIPQTRPGFAARLSLPDGNFQGNTTFRMRKTIDGVSVTSAFCVAAVDGKIYAIPFEEDGTLNQPAENNFEPFRLKNISFKADAKNVYWAVGDQSLAANQTGALTVVPTPQVSSIS